MVSTFSRCVVALFIAALSGLSIAAEITVRADRDHIRVDESFQLIFEVQGGDSGDPDFNELQQNFDVLSRSQSSSVRIINGNMDRQQQWQVTVMAKQAGQMLVPPVRFGNAFSKPLTLTINKANAVDPDAGKADMFLEVALNPESAYVQSQVVYTVRFFRAVQINGASMHEPQINGAEALIEKMGDDKTYETRRNNRRYIVVERNYAVFPQQSGRITIGPVQLDAQVVVASRNMFDPFGQNTRTQRLQSEAIELDVKPIPASMQGQAWLPATELSLTEHWSGDEFIVGEPVTRTLTLKAEGVTAAQLPPMHRESRDFKSYPDQPRLNDRYSSGGASASRQEKIALIPTAAGEFVLPAIEVNWWNTQTNRLETARIDERRIQVKPGTQSSSSAAPAAPLPAATAQAVAPQETVTANAPAQIITEQDAGLWPWLSAALGLGWLLTALTWWNSRRHRQSLPAAKHAATRADSKAIKQACLANDANKTHQALLDWARAIWPEAPPTNLAALAAHLAASSHPLHAEFDSLQRSLYGAAPADWRGSELWQQLEPLLKTAQKQQQTAHRRSKSGLNEKNLLLPLYP